MLVQITEGLLGLVEGRGVNTPDLDLDDDDEVELEDDDEEDDDEDDDRERDVVEGLFSGVIIAITSAWRRIDPAAQVEGDVAVGVDEEVGGDAKA